jgi:hypothetical protein
MLATYGQVTSVASGAAYEHTFDLLEEAEHPTLSLYVNEPTYSKVFPFGALNSLEFSFETGKILDFSADFMSRSSTNQSSTPTFTDVPFFRPKDFHFYIADDIAGLDTATEIPLRTFGLNFNKNIEADDVLGAAEYRDFLGKVFGVEASLELLHEDDTWKDLFKDGTPKAIRIQLINPSVDLGGGVNPSLTFDFAKVYFSGWEESNGQDDLKTESIDMTFALDIDEPTIQFGQARLVNSVESYT